MAREFDIVVFGATGFTGGLVCEYLAATTDVGERWAIAGRNKGKLEALSERYGVPSIVASSSNDAQLQEMCARTKVVLTTVGPYESYGEPLVKAAIAEKTDYVDITGEPAFVSRMVTRYHQDAKDAGVRIVSCCGFDSVPHDFGAWLAARELPSEGDIRVEGFVSAKGTFSGGTWHSAIKAMSEMRQQPRKKKRTGTGSTRRAKIGGARVRYEPRLGSWVAPLPTIDPVIVCRSAETLPEYGRSFSYTHYLQVEKFHKLVGGAAGIAGAFALSQTERGKNWLLSKVTPGEGPSAEKRARSSFEVRFFGSAGRASSEVVVSGGDPGYTETSKMIAEAARVLAHDRAKLPQMEGVLTPVQALGEFYVDRLRQCGITFDVLRKRV